MTNLPSKIWMLLGLFMLMPFIHANAQSNNQLIKPFQLWENQQGNSFLHYEAKSVTDAANNVYVVGATINALNNYDILVIKYNRKGVFLWSDQVSGDILGDDFATDVIVDSAGDIIVSGAIENGSFENYDFWVRKYSSAGAVLWTDEYDGTAGSYDGATCLAIDPLDNIYVGGGTVTTSGGFDFITRNYNSTGTVLWTHLYDNVNQEDIPGKINYSSAGVKVAGGTQVGSNTWRYAVVNINPANGNQISTYVSTGATSTIDEIRDLRIDMNNNSYVLGGVQVSGQGYDLKLLKLNPTLDVVWERTINGSDNLDDVGEALFIDDTGNVFVTGYVSTSSNDKNMIAAKYNSSGTQLWQNEYDGADHGYDAGKAIEVNGNGDVFVGMTSFIGNSKDIMTMKLNSAGVSQWKMAYNGFANLDDEAGNLVIDDDENVIVTGSLGLFSGKKSVTLKYGEKSVVTPPDGEANPMSNYFLENKGQKYNTDGNYASVVRYYNENIYPITFYSDDKISMQFFQYFENSPTLSHRVDIAFNKGNSLQQIHALDKYSSYSNFGLGYIDGDSRERIEHTAELYSHDVWPNIDIRHSTNNNGLKFYYICNSGFSPTNLMMEITGDDGLSIGVNGELIIANSIENLSLPIPEAYQIDANGSRIDMNWSPAYSISGNEVTIQIGAYDANRELIIEVDKGIGTTATGAAQTENLLWSTYFGGSYQDVIVETDANEEFIWVTGQSRSPGFLAGTGPGSGDDFGDAFVARFGVSDAGLDWITTIGGLLEDAGIDIVANNMNDHCFVVGNTQSSDMPFDGGQGFNDTSYGGARDGFICEVNSFGSIQQPNLLRSYIGGGLEDRVHGVAYSSFTGDAAVPRVFIVGETNNIQNPTQFPIQSANNAFNQSTVSGSKDGFIMQFGGGYNNEWCTFFGSDEDDLLTDVKITTEGIVLCGKTEASTTSLTNNPPLNGEFPIATPAGAHQETSYPSNAGHFIATFSGSRSLLWSSFVGGETTSSNFWTAFDPSLTESGGNNNDIYFTSNTNAGVQIPIVNSLAGGNYNQPEDNESQSYICRFNPSRELVWRSRLGGIISDIEFYSNGAIDGIVVSGFDQSILSQDEPITQSCGTPQPNTYAICNSTGDAYIEDGSDNTIGGDRMYFMVFNEQDDLVWSSFYGSGSYNQFTGLSIAGNNLVTVGRALDSYTFEEFDVNTNLDYFDNILGSGFSTTIDGTIAMFALPDVLVGTEEKALEDTGDFILFPNPAENYLILSSARFMGKSLSINMHSVTGALCKQIEYPSSNAAQSIRIDTSDLVPGIYAISLTLDGERQKAQKFVKQ